MRRFIARLLPLAPDADAEHPGIDRDMSRVSDDRIEMGFYSGFRIDPDIFDIEIKNPLPMFREEKIDPCLSDRSPRVSQLKTRMGKRAARAIEPSIISSPSNIRLNEIHRGEAPLQSKCWRQEPCRADLAAIKGSYSCDFHLTCACSKLKAELFRKHAAKIDFAQPAGTHIDSAAFIRSGLKRMAHIMRQEIQSSEAKKTISTLCGINRRRWRWRSIHRSAQSREERRGNESDQKDPKKKSFVTHKHLSSPHGTLLALLSRSL